MIKQLALHLIFVAFFMAVKCHIVLSLKYLLMLVFLCVLYVLVIISMCIICVGYHINVYYMCWL